MLNSICNLVLYDNVYIKYLTRHIWSIPLFIKCFEKNEWVQQWHSENACQCSFTI